MKKKHCFILLTLLFFSNVSFVNANSRTYKLKATSCKMAECHHPRNGFVFKYAPKEISFNNDSFILDFNQKNFRWTDNKGSKVFVNHLLSSAKHICKGI